MATAHVKFYCTLRPSDLSAGLHGQVVKLRQITTFLGDRSNRCGDIAIFVFQHGGRLQLRFLKLQNFNGCKGCGDMAGFDFFKMAAAAILDF